MNRVLRILFYLFAAFLWILVLLGALELWPRLQWALTENCNPYLIARQKKTPWPDAGNSEEQQLQQDTATYEQYRGRGKSVTPLPVVTAEQELSQRIPFFFDYEDPERFLFASVFKLHVFRLQEDGLLTVSYSIQDYPGTDTIDEYVDKSDVQNILDALRQQAFWNETIHFLKANDQELKDTFGYCLAIPPENNPRAGRRKEAWLLFQHPDAKAVEPSNPLWELSFMTYKKHSEKHDLLNVLGITEDFYINNCGFRDRDIMLPKPTDVYRILCIGASTTEEGITNDQTYPAILERIINQHFDNNSVDVINCGISGMNAMKHRMRFPDYLALEPNMMVIYNATNDICHQLLHKIVREATPRQQQLRHSRFVVQYFNHLLIPDNAQIRESIRSLIMPNLYYIIEEAQKRGIQPVICSFAAPTLADLSSKEFNYYNYLTIKEWGGSYITFESYLRILSLYNEELKKLCDETGSLYIPVAERLQGGCDIFGDICHLRHSGIENKSAIIADILIPYLETGIVNK